MRRFFCLFLCVVLCSSIAMPVKAATDDYLDITLADIIIAWYNASGVAIGDTQLANAIYDAYGSITLDDLVEHDCLTAPDAVIAPNTPEMREYVRELIGYGNLSVPMIAVSVGKLQDYLSGYPVSDVARESLTAMFGWDGNFYSEAMFSLLGMAIGSAVNIGKLAYNCVVDTITDVSDIVKNSYMGKTLLDVYRHFTDSTYFQNLLSSSGGEDDGKLSIGYSNGNYEGVGLVSYSSNYGFACRLPRDVVLCMYGRDGDSFGRYCVAIFNLNDESVTCQWYQYNSSNINDGFVNVSDGQFYNQTIPANSYFLCSAYTSVPSSYSPYAVDKALFTNEFISDSDAYNYCLENNPWGSSGGGSTSSGVTKYINNTVGNIASDNYINLSPNIGNNQYMYIFDRLTYIETLNQITENTDNGDYSDNSTVINNYNNTYIEQPAYVTIRPSTAPADPDQPAQPFISPRPTQAPEEYEGIIYEGGISEEITKKFPFCIPWDIKAMIDRLWVPEARAPYIHWEATFGSWGKLGEVDVDLEEFSGVAVIFRSTTLLLWIVWLVIITRDLLG